MKAFACELYVCEKGGAPVRTPVWMLCLISSLFFALKVIFTSTLCENFKINFDFLEKWFSDMRDFRGNKRFNCDGFSSHNTLKLRLWGIIFDDIYRFIINPI